MVLCVFQTRFECSSTLVVNGFDHVIYKFEQALTSNSLLYDVQRDICWLKSRNLSAKLVTLNVVLCVFQTRFKRSLTLVVNDFCYVIYKIEQALTSNSLLCAVQAQDTLQIHLATVCSEIVFLHCIAVKESTK